MKIEEFETLTGNVLSNLSDQGKVSEYLNQINEAYKTNYTTTQTLTTKQSDYEKEIDGLKQTNMNLFLKLQSEPENKTAAQTKTDEPLTYDQLVEKMGDQ